MLSHVLALPLTCAFAHFTLFSVVIPARVKMLSHSWIQVAAFSPEKWVILYLGVKYEALLDIAEYWVVCFQLGMQLFF
jgi:hypothetical protein